MQISTALIGVSLIASFVLVWGLIGVLLGRFLTSLALSILGVILAIHYERREFQKNESRLFL